MDGFLPCRHAVETHLPQLLWPRQKFSPIDDIAKKEGVKDKTWTLELTEKDLKKLRFQKTTTMFLSGIMSFVVVLMAIFGVVMVFADGDDMAGMILAGASIVILFFAIWIRRHYKKLKADVKGGVKEAVQGTLEDKIRHRANCQFTISGKTYHVDMDAYFDYDKGDQVLISFGPASKVMLQIEKIDKPD